MSEGRPFSSPSSEVTAMLKFLWQEHKYELPLVLGGVVEIDPRLKYALMSDDQNLADAAIKLLGLLISMSPSSRTIMSYIIRAFPDAMRNMNITLQQPITLKRGLVPGDDKDMMAQEG